MTKSYDENFITHLRHRYKSIENKSKECNVPYLSFEDFIIFAKNQQEPITNLTLEEAFNKKLYNDLEVDHKQPISKGGTSLLDNLTLTLKVFNRMKSDNSLEEMFKYMEVFIENKDKIFEAYSN